MGAGGFTPDAEADGFVRSDGFAFLVAVICDEQVRFESAWNAPSELARRLGHWNLQRIAAEVDEVEHVFRQPPALHRWVTKTALRVSSAAHKVLQEYGGDATRIWSDGPTAHELRARFEAFDGVGQKKSAMAVELLERGLGVDVRLLSGSDVAVDVHVRRVFLRTGLATHDDISHMVAVARALNPERPGELDNPAWDIGRQWCHARAPECEACPLTEVCPRLIERGDMVRGV